MSESSAVVSDAVEAVANAPETISRIFDLAERLVYGATYTAAYAVVFPVALLFAVVPKQNPLMRGVIEGTEDAKARAQRMIG